MSVLATKQVLRAEYLKLGKQIFLYAIEKIWRVKWNSDDVKKNTTVTLDASLKRHDAVAHDAVTHDAVTRDAPTQIWRVPSTEFMYTG